DSRPALNTQIDAVVNRERAIFLVRALKLENLSRAAVASRKRNRRRLLRSLGRLQPFNFLQLLDAALHEARLARLGAEAADETFDMLDFKPLLLIRRHLERVAFFARNQVARIAADIFRQPPARDFD